MLNDLLTIGDKIDLKPLDKNRKPLLNARTFASKLLDFHDDNIIHIAAPIVHNNAMILGIGENFNLFFYTGKGLYQCNCIVLSNHKENNLFVSVLRMTSELEKYQRRQYYRLECVHDIEYRMITVEEEILSKKIIQNDFKNQEERSDCRARLAQFEKEWIRGAIIDISGGGAKFSSPAEHKKGDKLKFKIELVINNKLQKLVLDAVIIASVGILNRKDAYEQRIEFYGILQKDQDTLIKYIFEQERKRRRNDIL